MYKTLDTPRLLMDQITNKDVDSVFFLRTNPDVIKFIKRDPYTILQEAEDFVVMITNQLREEKSLTWALRLKGNPEMIGSICLWNFSEDRKTAELGYDLKPNYHGLGLMTEAMTAVTDFGFKTLQLDMIEAFTSRFNEKSKIMLSKFGFQHQPDRKDIDNLDNFIYELRS